MSGMQLRLLSFSVYHFSNVRNYFREMPTFTPTGNKAVSNLALIASRCCSLAQGCPGGADWQESGRKERGEIESVFSGCLWRKPRFTRQQLAAGFLRVAVSDQTCCRQPAGVLQKGEGV